MPDTKGRRQYPTPAWRRGTRHDGGQLHCQQSANVQRERSSELSGPRAEPPNPATGRPYFERAVASIEAQRVDGEVRAIVGYDLSPVPLGQARPFNQAIARADGDVLALLEDDDTWDSG